MVSITIWTHCVLCFRELSSTFARLGHQVDIAKTELEEDIRQLQTEVNKLDGIATKANFLRYLIHILSHFYVGGGVNVADQSPPCITVVCLFLLPPCTAMGCSGSVVQRRSGDRVVRIPLAALRFGTLAIPFTPLCQCFSEETLKAVGAFYLVSMSGEVKDPTSPHWNV